MKTGWRSAQLGDFIELISGQHIDSQDYNTNGLGVGYLTGPSDFGPIFPTVTKWTKHPKVKAKKNDILITVKGSGVGKVNILDAEEVAISRQLMAIRVVNADRQFVYLFLESVFDHFQAESTGAAIPGISREQVLTLQISVPPLPEQQRIVGVLDKAFAGLATVQDHAARNLQNARALFASHLQSIFTHRGEGWIEKQLSELCEIKHGYAFEGEFFSNQGNYVLLTPGNFHETGGYRDRGEKQKYYTGPIRRDFVLKRGDMLVAMTEQAAGLLGSPILVPESDKFLHNQRLGLVIAKPDAQWLNEFFFHVFNLAEVRQAIHESASGTKVRHTSPTKIGAISVWFPQISEQRLIVSQLDALAAETQQLTRIYEEKQAALAALKKSLLHQAFSGEL